MLIALYIMFMRHMLIPRALYGLRTPAVGNSQYMVRAHVHSYIMLKATHMRSPR